MPGPGVKGRLWEELWQNTTKSARSMKNYIDLQELDLRELSSSEKLITGRIGLIPFMFIAGMTYGYVKAKIESGELKFK